MEVENCKYNSSSSQTAGGTHGCVPEDFPSELSKTAPGHNHPEFRIVPPLKHGNVHQVKKSMKFDCKVCGEKQSVKRNYGVGSGRECRLHVQKLNLLRGEADELMDKSDLGSTLEFDDSFAIDADTLNTVRPSSSKWSQYVEREDFSPATVQKESMTLQGVEVVLELPKKTFKRKKCSYGAVNLLDNRKRIKDESVQRTNYTYDEHKDRTRLQHEVERTNNKPVIPVTCKPLSNNIGNIGPVTEASRMSNENTSKPLENSCSVSTSGPEVDWNSLHHNEHISASDSDSIGTKVSRNSKWAQFVDDTYDEVNESVDVDSEDIKNPDLQATRPVLNESKAVTKLFSQCRDEELDDLLEL